MDAAAIPIVQELQKYLRLDVAYKAIICLDINAVGKIFERLINEGFSSFVVQHQQTPAATAIAVVTKDRQSELRFERILQEMAREGLVDIALYK